ncbi:MAG: M15 family metallopeptidase [Bacteroidota bacterium]
MMSYGTILNELIKNGTLSQLLKRSDTPKDEVKAFKQILYELGFDAVVDPISQQIDGLYGDSTVATVKSFCEKNQLPGDGEVVNEPIAKAIIQRHNSLPDMLQLHQDLQSGQIGRKYFKGSANKQAVAALQQLLHDLGYHSELEWEKHAKDGVYGAATINAVQTFLKDKEAGVSKRLTSGLEKLVDASPVKELVHNCGNVLTHLMHTGELSDTLQKEQSGHPAIGDLKNVLHRLGFGKELGQKISELDHNYGDGLINALRSFGKKNGLSNDGTKVTRNLAGALQKRLEALPFMHQLQRDLREGKVEQKYFSGSKDKIAVSALQYLLQDLGMGKELKWKEKGNDGNFDHLVSNALKGFFKKGLFTRMNKVTPHMAHSILQTVGQKYGADWKEHIKTLQGNNRSVLTTFTASNFQGKPVITNVAFVPHLQKINQYAVKNNVKVYVTNSYRRSTFVPGAIVPPASMSNHKVGHAIDMNLIYGKGQWANSQYLNPANRDKWAAPVRGFLEDIINDEVLRWGGNFHGDIDPVHIDDDLNHADPKEWHIQRELTVKAYDANDIAHWSGE